MENKLDLDLRVLKTSVFSKSYPEVNSAILNDGNYVESRNGKTKEFISFKTILTEPRYRCVGGYERNANIFFLLAESLWIWMGRKDVYFLNIFNGRMKNYSDNGKCFHAPYGWRLRNWGLDSLEEIEDSNKHEFGSGIDQIEGVINLLKENKEDRRAVMSIWNPYLDLGAKKLDLPCNDMVMFKIRNNKLYSDIANRSNDLHWGLTTNVFQFSIIGEFIARILGVELGEQAHNSQSLHVYLDNPLTPGLENNYIAGKYYGEKDLYDFCAAKSFDFNWDVKTLNIPKENRLGLLDFFIRSVIISVINEFTFTKSENDWLIMDDSLDVFLFDNLKRFSKRLYIVWYLLKIYAGYKSASFDNLEKKKSAFIKILNLLNLEYNSSSEYSDFIILAINFFFVSLKKDLGLEEICFLVGKFSPKLFNGRVFQEYWKKGKCF